MIAFASLSHNRVLHTASPQIAPEEVNLPRPYRSTLSLLRSSFCSSLYSYREKIGVVPSPLCPFCELEPHSTVHVFSCSSHLIPLTELDLWERQHLSMNKSGQYPSHPNLCVWKIEDVLQRRWSKLCHLVCRKQESCKSSEAILIKVRDSYNSSR